ncbi:hypothetical protein EBS02_12095, partial [bacterium]|nr:hypothetical protein [bacterium]
GFEEMLKKQNTTEAILKQRIEDQLLIEKLTESLFSNETLVHDEDVKNYFKLHEKEFINPERIHAFQIVVPTKEEAEKMKRNNEYESVDLEHNKLFAGVINGLSAIKDETQRVIFYWQSFQNKLKSSEDGSVSSIKKVILSGHDAVLPGLREYFATSLNVQVEVANVWQNVLNLKDTVPDIEYNDSLDFATAIGLALPKHRY